MTRLILFVVVAAALAIGAAWLADYPAEVVIQGQGYELRTSLGILIGSFLAFGVFMALAYRFWRWATRLPRDIGRRGRQKRTMRGYQALTSGLIAAMEGDSALARRRRDEASRLLPGNAGVLVLSAQTAQLGNDEDEAAQSFRRMLDLPETELMGLRGLLSQAIKAGDREEALELARRAVAKGPDAPWAVSALFDLLTRTREWTEALRLVDRLQSLGVVVGAEAARHRAALRTMRAREFLRADRPMDALKDARKGLSQAPAFTPAAVLSAETAIRLGRDRDARKLLESAWSEQPHPDLVRAYAAMVPSEGASDRLKRFERLRSRRPDHVETRLTMAELALAATRPDLARTEVEAALAAGPTTRCYRLMAEIERAIGAPPATIQSWQEQAIAAKPDPAWVCDDTGDILAAWEPFGHSGRFNTVRWVAPPRVQVLADARPVRTLGREPMPAEKLEPEEAAAV